MKFQFDTDKFIQDISIKQENINKKLNNAVKRTANQIRGDIIKDTPSDKGGLKISIHTRKDDESSYSVYTNKKYAPYVEFGTGERGSNSNTNTDIKVTYTKGWLGMKAQPYFYPNFYKGEKFFKEQVNKIIGGKDGN